VNYGRELVETAKALVARNKGILAADESVGTIGKRFAKLGVPSTAETHRAYRDMLFTSPVLRHSFPASSCTMRRFARNHSVEHRFHDFWPTKASSPVLRWTPER